VPVGFLRARELRRRAQQVLDSLSLPVRANELAGRLPLIHQRLVMVARALSFRARLVIFDEPTAAVSPLEVELVLEAIQRLSAGGVSILYVSHRLDEIERVCDSVTVLRDGRVVADVGREQARHADLVRLLASGSEAQGQTREPTAPGDPVLEIAGLTGERLRGIELMVHRGEIVGLAGLAGSGARELLLTIAGAVPFAEGTVRLRGRRLPSGRPRSSVQAGVAYLPGDRGLAAFPSESVAYNASLPAVDRYALGPFIRRSRERSAVATLLDRVGVRARPDTPMSSLSGGNQQRVIAARWIDSQARVLLLDDPSAGVDVGTRPRLHEQVRSLAAEGAAVLLVSTDVDELVDLADRIVAFDRGTIADELSGVELTPANVLAAMTRASADR
jgi:ABC-type sugar transport system ATPase subunit